MKKIPTVFVRDEVKRQLVTRVVTPGCEWVLMGEGIATYKWNGTACLVKEGVLYARYDARRKEPPAGFLPADDKDERGGHWLGWLPVGDRQEYRWQREAWENAIKDPDMLLVHVELTKSGSRPVDGTYEVCGPKIPPARGEGIVNPHGFDRHRLIPHGKLVLDIGDGARSYEMLLDFFRMYYEMRPEGYIEGLVFWRDGQPGAKIKASDFGIRKPTKQ